MIKRGKWTRHIRCKQEVKKEFVELGLGCKIGAWRKRCQRRGVDMWDVGVIWRKSEKTRLTGKWRRSRNGVMEKPKRVLTPEHLEKLRLGREAGWAKQREKLEAKRGVEERRKEERSAASRELGKEDGTYDVAGIDAEALPDAPEEDVVQEEELAEDIAIAREKARLEKSEKFRQLGKKAVRGGNPMIYALAVTDGFSKEAAKKEAGYSEKTAATQIEKSPEYVEAQKRVLGSFARVGLTEDLIARKLLSLLNKKQKIVVGGKIKVVDENDTAANSSALEMILKVRGDFAPMQVQNMNPMSNIPIQQLMGMMKELAQNGGGDMDALRELFPK